MKNGIKLVFISILAFASSGSISAQDSTLSFTLKEAHAYALKNGYQARISAKDVEQSEKKVDETIASGLPQINANASYQQYIKTPIQLVPSSAFGGPEDEFQEVFFGTEQQIAASVTAEQLIFDGAYFVGLSAAKVYLELAKNQQVRSDIETKNMVTLAYGSVLVAEENTKILEQNVINLEAIVFETTETYKSGFAEEQDKDQVDLLLATTKNDYNRSLRQIDFSRNQFKYLLGIPIETKVVLSNELLDFTDEFKKSEFAENKLDLENHIDYKTILTQERATELLFKQQRSGYYPKLSAFYTYQQNSFANEFNFFGNERRWYDAQLVGLNLKVPIFTSFNRRFQVQQSKIEFQKVQIAREQVEQKLKIDADNAKSEYIFALSQYRTSNSNLALAERIYDKVKTKYEEGLNSSLDLTQANDQLLESQSNFIRASFQLIDAKVNLDKALNTY